MPSDSEDPKEIMTTDDLVMVLTKYPGRNVLVKNAGEYPQEITSIYEDELSNAIIIEE
jgi:hypothetical protein